jgi:hypothetical protein
VFHSVGIAEGMGGSGVLSVFGTRLARFASHAQSVGPSVGVEFDGLLAGALSNRSQQPTCQKW